MDLAKIKAFIEQMFSQLVSLYTKVIYTNKRDTIIFLVCLAISSTMWLLLALSENYTATITVPLEFKNFPEDRIVVSELPSEMEMDVEAAGFSLISYRLFSSFNEVVLDLGDLRVSKNAKHYSVATSFFENQLIEQLSSQDRLITIYPDSLSIDFSPKVFKKVPINVDDSLQFRRQFFLEDKVQVKPDSVTLYGPAMYLKNLSEVKTSRITLTDLHEPQSKDLSLVLPDSISDVSLDTETVNCFWNIDQFTEKVITVKVNTVLSQEHKSVKLYPDSVEIVCQVGLKNFEKVTPSMFSVVADFDDSLTWKGMQKVRLKLAQSSEDVDFVRIRPTAVEYLFKNNSRD